MLLLLSLGTFQWRKCCATYEWIICCERLFTRLNHVGKFDYVLRLNFIANCFFHKLSGNMSIVFFFSVPSEPYNKEI